MTNAKRVKRAAEDCATESDVFRILICTDLHVGYGERDPLRRNDSFDTLGEILQIAKERNADFILCAGDLFHENKPSRFCVNRVTQLLRQHCMYERRHAYKTVSNANNVYHNLDCRRANVDDEHLNVGMPIYTIHGNHDDLSGPGLTALDPLHEAGLINLFGKHVNNERYTVHPLLFHKGGTKLAVYGIGSQRDDRLARALMNNEVDWRIPNDNDEYFNVLLLHQNRPVRTATRTTGAHIDVRLLPKHAHLIVWGHEHECKIEPEKIGTDDLNETGSMCNAQFITQPGSSVATSLSSEEAGDKKVALLKVQKQKFELIPITLQTTRQFLWRELVLEETGARLPTDPTNRGTRTWEDETIAVARVKKMIDEARSTRRPRQPAEPLVRLRVVYSGPWRSVEPFNAGRVSGQFHPDEGNEYAVANPKNVFIFKCVADKQRRVEAQIDNTTLSSVIRQTRVENKSIDHAIDAYFRRTELNETRAGIRYMQILTERGMREGLHSFAAKDEGEAISTTVDVVMERTERELCKRFAKDTSLAESTIKDVLDILAQGRREKIYRDELREKQEKEESERNMAIKSESMDDLSTSSSAPTVKRVSQRSESQMPHALSQGSQPKMTNERATITDEVKPRVLVDNANRPSILRRLSGLEKPRVLRDEDLIPSRPQETAPPSPVEQKPTKCGHSRKNSIKFDDSF